MLLRLSQQPGQQHRSIWFLTTLCFEPRQRQLCTVDVLARPTKEGRSEKADRAAEDYDLIQGLESTSRLGQEHSTSVKSYVSRRASS